MIRIGASLAPSPDVIPVNGSHGRRAVLAVVIILALSAAFTTITAGRALAQHSDDAGLAPPPPPGPGQLSVQIVAESAGESVEGLSIALYALAPDGTPGLTHGETDAEGRVTFTGISNDPDIVYLVGARYAEIPFGERVAFGPGVTEAHVEIQVSAPVDHVSGVEVEEIRVRVDWLGDRIVVTEIVRLASSGSRVIQLSEENRSQAILRRTLPARASDFSAGASSIGDGLALEDGVVRFWGPLYPGQQRIEYRYSLPVAVDSSGNRTLDLPIELREAASRVVIVAGTPGIEAAGPGFVAASDVRSDSGQPLSAWARGALAAGQRIEVQLTLPESRLDASALTIPRGDVWIDLDDTRVTVNVDLQLEVEPGAPISGTPDAPLFHVSLPTGASLEGVAPAVESMGIVPTADDGFDVIGPIGPGKHSFGYSYRLPSHPDGVALEMRFPRDIATLNVLIADTGLSLDSSRLHRRRPFRNGTRNYLHREAFNVGLDEVVDLTLEPLSGEGLPREASIALTVAGGAAAALFLVAPLRRRAEREEHEDTGLIRIREKREAVYTAIGDLDHDFETGKLDESDYTEMRSRLRSEAIELLRSERGAGDAATREATPVDPPETSGVSELLTSRFCPSCGDRVDPQWHFCSHCGGALNPLAETSVPAAEASAQATSE